MSEATLRLWSVDTCGGSGSVLGGTAHVTCIVAIYYVAADGVMWKGHDVGSSVCHCLGMLVGELMSALPTTQIKLNQGCQANK